MDNNYKPQNNSNKDFNRHISIDRSSFPIGITNSGQRIDLQFADFSNMLIYGNPGSGKTSFVYSLLYSLLAQFSSNKILFIVFDSKMVDYSFLKDSPYLLCPIITSSSEMKTDLLFIQKEIERRANYIGSTPINGFDADSSNEDDLAPANIFIILDDLNTLANDDYIRSLLEKVFNRCNSVGVHVIATATSLTPRSIKNTLIPYFPQRVVFKCSKSDSTFLADTTIGPNLTAPGEVIYNSFGTNIKCQNVFTEFCDIKDYVQFQNAQSITLEDLGNMAATIFENKINVSVNSTDEEDRLLSDAISFAEISEKVSVSSLQRRFGIGYNRAAHLLDLMEERGIVSSYNGTAYRLVLKNNSYIVNTSSATIPTEGTDYNNAADPISALTNISSENNSSNSANIGDGDLLLRDFPLTNVEGCTISISNNKVHIHSRLNYSYFSGYGKASFSGDAIEEIHYRPAGLITKGQLYFSIKTGVNWVPGFTNVPTGINVNDIPKEQYTTITFKKSNNNTMRILAEQLAEDIGQNLIID